MSKFSSLFIYLSMSMMDEIDKFMNSADISLSYRTINLGGKRVYIEGIRDVINILNDEVSFSIRGGILVVGGKGLKLSYLDKTSCVIEGEISSVVKK